MDLVVVGLPGSGKTAIGRRIAARHGARFIDLDATVEEAAGLTIAQLFEGEGEAGFRSRERAAVAALGRPDPAPELRRVIATGGGTIVDPANRWALYRGRRAVWLNGPPEVLAQRLRNSPHPRPLLQGRDPLGAIRELAAGRERFYAPALRLNGLSQVGAVLDRIDAFLRGAAPVGTTLLAADTRLGRIRIGESFATAALVQVLAAWDWQERPAGVVTLPSRTRPRLIASLGERIAEIGRLPLLGSLGYTGPGPRGSGQFNSPQRLQAVWRELQLPGPLAEAVASLGGPVLVIDDRVDSGWTMTVAARLLRQSGAARVLPLVLAATTG